MRYQKAGLKQSQFDALPESWFKTESVWQNTKLTLCFLRRRPEPNEADHRRRGDGLPTEDEVVFP